jgi:ATP-binding cassette, subfamily B, bacterial
MPFHGMVTTYFCVAFMPGRTKARSSYWQLLPFLRPHLWRLLVGTVLTLFYTISLPAIAWTIGDISVYIGKGDYAALSRFGGIVAGIFIGRGLFQYLKDIVAAQAAFSTVLDLRRRTYRHLLTLGTNFFSTVKTGDLAYRLTADVDAVADVIYKAFCQLLPNSLQLIALLAYMIYLNWTLTLAVIVIAPFIGVIIGWFGNKLQGLSRSAQDKTADLASLITEAISGIRIVQSFAAERYAETKYTQESDKIFKHRYRSEAFNAIQFPLVTVIQAMGIFLLFILAAWQIGIGSLSVPQFISYAAAVGLIIDPILFTTNNYNQIKQTEASLDRIFELFKYQPTVAEAPNAIVLPPIQGKIEYSHLEFGYNPQEPILTGFNLQIAAGEKIALVGASGAGKTTLINLLSRFYDPQNGTIAIDGIDIATVTLQSLRRQIGLVPQDTSLFSGTIADNIAFGQLEYDLDSAIEAAKIANAHQFISSFSQGYHTWVGDRGANLSGGQKQRIAIARAIFTDPKILVLDEATSALDAESEAAVKEALERVTVNRTVLIIAHRLATVRSADRILVLERGKIVESGSHEELLSLNGKYARYYALQFQ